LTNNDHPWVMGDSSSSRPIEVPAATPERHVPRATRPQTGVAAVEKADQLPRREVKASPALWFVGAHGGSGESTLAQLVPGGAAAGHSWPVAVDGSASAVVLVCRSNTAGLRAAQRAAQDWASGSLPGVRLLGLVVVADAKGALPKPLRDLVQVLSGAVPRAWSMPWLDALRLGQPLDLPGAPRAIRSMVASIAAASSSN
jgi:hypothetical protein